MNPNQFVREHGMERRSAPGFVHGNSNKAIKSRMFEEQCCGDVKRIEERTEVCISLGKCPLRGVAERSEKDEVIENLLVLEGRSD